MKPNSLLLPAQLCGKASITPPAAKYEAISIPPPPPPSGERCIVLESSRRSSLLSSRHEHGDALASTKSSLLPLSVVAVTSSRCSCNSNSSSEVDEEAESCLEEAHQLKSHENLKVLEGLDPSLASPTEILEKQSEDKRRVPNDRHGASKTAKSSETNESPGTQVAVCPKCKSIHLGIDYDIDSDLDDEDDMSTTMEQFYHCLCCVIVVGILALFVTTLIWMFENRQQVPVSPRGHLWTFRSIQPYEHLTRPRETNSYHLRHSSLRAFKAY